MGQSQKAAQRAALVVATLTSFLGPFMASSVNVALPSIGDELSMGAVSLAWINTAFLLAAATFLIPFGRLGDIHGRKQIFMWGILGFAVASGLLATANSGTSVIMWRAVQGLGASMVFATGLPILISVYPAGKRGAVLGLNVAAVYLGLSMGPYVGGLITGHLGWRYVFWMNVPVGLFILAISFFMLEGDWADAEGARFDLAGSALLGVALLTLMLGLARMPSATAVALLVAGFVSLIVFVRYELRIDYPVLEIDLFRHNTVFAMSNLAALINYAATFAVGFLLSLYLQRVRGLAPQDAGLVLIAQPVVQALVSPLAGKLSDRSEPRTVASLGMAITFLGLVLLVFLDETTEFRVVVGCLAVLGLGFGIFSSPNTNAIMGAVERRFFGVAGAMVGTMRHVGMMVSMGLVMTVLAVLMGAAEISSQNQDLFLEAMRISFGLFAALCFGGIFASMARGRVER
ncbi:MAG: MFS transporter [Acidobacteria bacterium]|nr:MAG: MFS transporter [Acidobacteriota bacterium]